MLKLLVCGLIPDVSIRLVTGELAFNFEALLTFSPNQLRRKFTNHQFDINFLHSKLQDLDMTDYVFFLCFHYVSGFTSCHVRQHPGHCHHYENMTSLVFFNFLIDVLVNLEFVCVFQQIIKLREIAWCGQQCS